MKPVQFIRDYCGLDLRDFQVEWLNEPLREKNGERVYSQALWGVPRGNGKTETRRRRCPLHARLGCRAG